MGEKSRNLTLRHAHRVRSTHCGGVAGRARPAGRAQCDAPRRPLRAARTTAVASCRTAIRQVQRPVVSRPRRPQGRQAARRARAVNTHRKGVERAQAHGRAHREDAMTAAARRAHHHGRPTPRTKGGAEASAVLRPRRPRGREAASLPRSVRAHYGSCAHAGRTAAIGRCDCRVEKWQGEGAVCASLESANCS